MAVVAVLGPTAVGKSRLALELAERLGGEIVSGDALQAYRGFDIGTAKPTTAERRRVPHHLLDILEPNERYSAGEFARRARSAITAIEERGRLAIVVGGSGLYLRALLEGISDIPPVDASIRRRLRNRCRREGLTTLAGELRRLDPPTAARLDPGDRQRILRALEVVASTGRPLSAWTADEVGRGRRLEAARIGLTLSRPLLYDRIAYRVRRMIQNGWVAEVRGLLGRGLDPSLPAFQAIGYRSLARHLRGESSLAETSEEITRDTRRLAKRQWTWFGKQPGIVWFDAEEVTLGDVVASIRSGPDGRVHAQT